MKKTVGLMCMAILFSLFSPSPSTAGDTPVYGDTVTIEIRKLIAKELGIFHQKHNFSQGGLAVRLITPKGDYFAAVGMGKDIDEHIHFRAASTTKTFTAASIMLMHQQGLLHIDDFVVDNIPSTSRPYLPNIPEYDIPHKNQITIRHLLGHRAGVFDVSNDDIPESANAPYAGKRYTDYIRDTLGDDHHTFTFDEMVGVVAANSLSYWPPGEGFHYSNTGYSILGKIIERISGMSYGEYVRRTFTGPLKLADTRFPDMGTDTALPSPYAAGYTLLGGRILETTEDNMSQAVAEGNVITTPQDLSRWITLLLSGRAGLSKKTVAEMMNVSKTGEHHVWYGLGITKTVGLGFGHNGGHVGYMTVLRYDPEAEVTVLVFTSFLVADDFTGQGEFLIDVAIKAREKAGYPGK